MSFARHEFRQYDFASRISFAFLVEGYGVTLAPGFFPVPLPRGVIVNPTDPGPGGMLINALYGLGFHLSPYRPGLQHSHRKNNSHQNGH
jgi:hypothetical protein